MRDKCARVLDSVGLNYIDDYNSGNEIGYSAFITNAVDGKRYFAGNSYTFGSNIATWTETVAARLMIKDGQANGVLCSDQKTKAEMMALAAKEVIVSAGAFMTPKLLLLRYACRC